MTVLPPPASDVTTAPVQFASTTLADPGTTAAEVKLPLVPMNVPASWDVVESGVRVLVPWLRPHTTITFVAPVPVVIFDVGHACPTAVDELATTALLTSKEYARLFRPPTPAAAWETVEELLKVVVLLTWIVQVPARSVSPGAVLARTPNWPDVEGASLKPNALDL